MNQAQAEIIPIERTHTQFYKLWRRRGYPPLEEGATFAAESLEFVGKVVTECVLDKPLLYVDPKGDIYRTSKVRGVSCLGVDGYFRLRTRNSEYILQVSTEKT